MNNLRRKVLSQGLKTAYHLLYHQFAWAYDFVADIVSLGAWGDWVQCSLPYLEGPRVLELGFGPGHLLRSMGEREITAFGVDASPQMARRAKRKASNLSLAYSENLPFPEARFDQVVATFPSNTILSAQTLRESRRVLVPGGTLIMLPIAWLNGKTLIEKSTAGLWRSSGGANPRADNYLERFTTAGFRAQAELINQDSWSLVIILAHKPVQAGH